MEVKFIVEKRYGGLKTFLHKCGSDVKIYNNSREDITENFPKLVSQAKEMSEEDFIIFGEIVDYSDLVPSGAETVVDYLNSKVSLDEMTLHVSDLLYLGSDLMDKPWSERRSALRKMSFPNNIKEIHALISTKAELDEVCDMVRKAPHSTGVVIKPYCRGYGKEYELVNDGCGKEESNAGEDTENTPNDEGFQPKIQSA